MIWTLLTGNTILQLHTFNRLGNTICAVAHIKTFVKLLLIITVDRRVIGVISITTSLYD